MPVVETCMPRLRNAAATREAMLKSARRHFARESYESVGLRDIARDAGVDPALVKRYFGGKRQLFKEALRSSGRPVTQGVALQDMAAHLASFLVDDTGPNEQREAQTECLLMMLRSSSSPAAEAIVRDAVSQDILHPLARLIGSEDAGVSASLALAVLMGSGILRSALGGAPSCHGGDGQLRDRLKTLFAVALR